MADKKNISAEEHQRMELWNNTTVLFNTIVSWLNSNRINDMGMSGFSFGFNTVTNEYVSTYDNDPVAKIFKSPVLFDISLLNHLCDDYGIIMSVTKKDGMTYYIFDATYNVEPINFRKDEQEWLKAQSGRKL